MLLVNSIKYIIKIASQSGHRIRLKLALINLLLPLNTLCSVLFLGCVVNALAEGWVFSRVLCAILTLSVLLMGSSACIYCLKSSVFMQSNNIRFNAMMNSGMDYLNIPYIDTLSPELLELSRRADMATENNASGIEGIIHSLADAPGNLITFIMICALSFTVAPALSALYLALSAAVYFLWSRVNKYEHAMRVGLVDAERKWTYLTGLFGTNEHYKDIFIYKIEDLIVRKFAAIKARRLSEERKLEREKCAAAQIRSLALFFVQTAMYALLGAEYFAGKLSIGEFTVALSAFASLYALAETLASSFTFARQQSEYVADFAEFSERIAREAPRPEPEASQDFGKIEARGLRFRYPSQTGEVINGVDLSIKQGEKIALVGPNGAGKSTLVNLLTGLYPPTEGSVRADGRAVSLSLFSVAFQKPHIFAFTVAENVSMKPLAQTDLDRVRLCLEKVGLGEKIAKLPKGLLQPLLKQLEADGAELSGGELQKLSLARVLYKDAPVLILDEPTSAYDPLSEERLYRLFDELTKDKTVVYISHRLASTRFCDRIIVLDGGRIIEEGGHEELMSAGGYYAELFELQAKMYREAAV